MVTRKKARPSFFHMTSHFSLKPSEALVNVVVNKIAYKTFKTTKNVGIIHENFSRDLRDVIWI